jgi:cytoskeletal protein RodZ
LAIVRIAVAIAATAFLSLFTAQAAERGNSSKSGSKHSSSAQKSSKEKRSSERSSKSSSARSHSKHRASKSKSRRSTNRNQQSAVPVQPDADVVVELPSSDFESKYNPDVNADRSGILLGTTDENQNVGEEGTIAADAFPLNDTDN